MAGTADCVVKVRIMASPEALKSLGDLVVDALETKGFQVIEWSREYPCPEPDADKKRVFITALTNQEH